VQLSPAAAPSASCLRRAEADRRHSPDHRLLAWLADEAGFEVYTARVRAIDIGANLAQVVPDRPGQLFGRPDAAKLELSKLKIDQKQGAAHLLLR
jgi:oligopeptidase B